MHIMLGMAMVIGTIGKAGLKFMEAILGRGGDFVNGEPGFYPPGYENGY